MPMRSARSMAKDGDLPRHSARGDTPPALPHDGPPCSDGAMQGAAGKGGAWGFRRRRWQCQSKLAGDTSMAMLADHTDNIAVSAATHCFESSSLVLVN
jgi:hypothetical protein